MARRRRVLVVASVVAGLLSPPATAGAVVPDCSMMTATPAPSALVVWCAVSTRSATTGRVEDVRLWRSSGDGRWSEAAASGIVVDGDPAPPSASPDWAHDHTLYWATDHGLFASTDLGETFTLVSSLATGTHHPARRVLLTQSGSGTTALVAGYDPHDVGYSVSGGTTTPAVGSPDDDMAFVVAPGGLGVLAWDTAVASPHRVVGYLCTSALVCGTPWFSLPSSPDGVAQQFAGAWRRAATPTEVSYVLVHDGASFEKASLWRVAADGVTPVTGADRVVAALSNGRNPPEVTFAFDGASLVMRVVSWGDRAGAAHEATYVSANGGQTWRAVVHATTDARGRASGPPGWRPGVVTFSFIPAVVVRGSVWLANVSDGARYTLRCSTDHGAHWKTTCSS